MMTAEDSYLILVTFCDDMSHVADLLVGRCNALLEKINDLLLEEQQTGIKCIRDSAQKLLSQAETAKEDMLNEDTRTAEEFRFRMGSVLFDMKPYLGIILGFIQLIIEEKLGPLNEEQAQVIRQIEKHGQSLKSIYSDALSRP